eukprot:2559946-Alexandrium_andersonii.AAC.1
MAHRRGPGNSSGTQGSWGRRGMRREPGGSLRGGLAPRQPPSSAQNHNKSTSGQQMLIQGRLE